MKKLAILFLFILSACAGLSLEPDPVPIEARPTLFLPGSRFLAVMNGISNEDRAHLYHQDEGIHYLPADVMVNLKRNNGGLGIQDELFFAKPERFGLVPDLVNPATDLPLGITVSDDEVPMAGINCATCHTSLVANASGEFFLIDGGASQFAIDRFIEGMVRSVAATIINPIEFEAFFRRLQVRADLRYGPNLEVAEDPTEFDPLLCEQAEDVQSDSSKLRALLALSVPADRLGDTLDSGLTVKDLRHRNDMWFYLASRLVFFLDKTKHATPDPGFAVAANGLGRSNPWGVTKRAFAANLGLKVKPKLEGGPVSTPSIWGYDRQKWIFWTGVTDSMVERNFAQGVALMADFEWASFQTTISVRKLEEISTLLRAAKPPSWPEAVLGPIDRELAQRGEALFRDNCLHCHDPRTDQTGPGTAEFNFVDVGTDPLYYLGQVENMGGTDLFTEVLAPTMGHIKDVAARMEDISDMGPFEVGRTPVTWRRPKPNAYAAKPLAGVWATGPFLHNGSVPTIADLLKPVKDRTAVFYVGGYVLDTAELGFSTNPQTAPWASRFDTSEPGNSNVGHEFFVDQPRALLEYLKTY